MKIHINEPNQTVVIPDENYIAPLGINKNNSSFKLSKKILENAFEKPISSEFLRIIARDRKKCALIIDDPSRPTPTKMILPLILDELHYAGIKDDDIIIFIAKGTHKTFSRDEIITKIGDLINQYEIIQNESDIDENYSDLGFLSSGNVLHIHKKIMDCDLKIGVGQIILSPFAGFTGGCKIILPGCCNNKTIYQNHMMAFHEFAKVGETIRNPVRKDMEEAANIVGLDYIYNVTINKESQVVYAACGDPRKVFEKGIQTFLSCYSVNYSIPLDIMIYDTYPSDKTLYYTLSKADIGSLAVKENGTVVVIGSCCNGLGEKEFYSLLEKKSSDIKDAAYTGLRTDWAGVSYRLTKILETKKIHVCVPCQIIQQIKIKNSQLSFSENLSDFLKIAIQADPNIKIGYISSQYSIPQILERGEL